VCCRYRAAPALWLLGYPDQAVASSQAALAASGHGEEGITQIRLAAYQATRAPRDRPYYLALLAEASSLVGQTTGGPEALDEALATVATSAVRWWEAELHRLKGELLLQSAVKNQESTISLRMRQRWKTASSRPSTSPAASKPSHWSCGRR
jgi:predicted ATPase